MAVGLTPSFFACSTNSRTTSRANLTSLERNGDVVRLASYAPLLAKQGHTQWQPDMIYFNNTNFTLSANYYVQQLFARNQGDVYLPTPLTTATTNLVTSCVRESKTGDIIIKLVNIGAVAQTLHVDLTGAKQFANQASQTVLTGELTAVNDFGKPASVVPQTSSITVDKSFDCEAPGHSLVVIRIKTRSL